MLLVLNSRYAYWLLVGQTLLNVGHSHRLDSFEQLDATQPDATRLKCSGWARLADWVVWSDPTRTDRKPIYDWVTLGHSKLVFACSNQSAITLLTFAAYVLVLKASSERSGSIRFDATRLSVESRRVTVNYSVSESDAVEFSLNIAVRLRRVVLNSP